jgi:hypothetical protein
VSQGVPFDVAFRLDDIRRTAWCIMFSEINGGKFNWKTMKYEDPK